MKLDYKDFVLTAEYLKKHCENQTLTINVTSLNELIITTSNKFDEQITIVCYNFDGGATSFPKVTKTERLTKDSK